MALTKNAEYIGQIPRCCQRRVIGCAGALLGVLARASQLSSQGTTEPRSTQLARSGVREPYGRCAAAIGTAGNVVKVREKKSDASD